MIFRLTDYDDHESVVFVRNKRCDLKAIIAIHDTTLGPAHGGTRFWSYPSDREAVIDALRLSRGMTYKNALAGIPFGGGKSVILADPRIGKTRALLEAFGDAVEALGGRYLLAEDVGIGPGDVAVIGGRTSYACGMPRNDDQASADPSPNTARGVFLAMKAGMAHQFGSDDLTGRRVAVQGLGGVGYNLCILLAAEGAELVVCDVDPKRTEQAKSSFDAKIVDPPAIYDVEADVFAPCALGAILNESTAERLKVSLVCGAANNQLSINAVGKTLASRNVLYLPDFVVNAGGVTQTTAEIIGLSATEVARKIEEIPDRVRRVLKRTRDDHTTPQEAAEQLAREIVAARAPSKSAKGRARPTD